MRQRHGFACPSPYGELIGFMLRVVYLGAHGVVRAWVEFRHFYAETDSPKDQSTGCSFTRSSCSQFARTLDIKTQIETGEYSRALRQ